MVNVKKVEEKQRAHARMMQGACALCGGLPGDRSVLSSYADATFFEKRKNECKVWKF
jgi:hypothetical protein